MSIKTRYAVSYRDHQEIRRQRLSEVPSKRRKQLKTVFAALTPLAKRGVEVFYVEIITEEI